jgi:hypothetical protein
MVERDLPPPLHALAKEQWSLTFPELDCILKHVLQQQDRIDEWYAFLLPYPWMRTFQPTKFLSIHSSKEKLWCKFDRRGIRCHSEKTSTQIRFQDRNGAIRSIETPDNTNEPPRWTDTCVALVPTSPNPALLDHMWSTLVPIPFSLRHALWRTEDIDSVRLTVVSDGHRGAEWTVPTENGTNVLVAPNRYVLVRGVRDWTQFRLEPEATLSIPPSVRGWSLSREDIQTCPFPPFLDYPYQIAVLTLPYLIFLKPGAVHIVLWTHHPFELKCVGSVLFDQFHMTDMPTDLSILSNHEILLISNDAGKMKRWLLNLSQP